MQATSTTTVAWITCDWPGHSTFFSSPHDSATKLPRSRRGGGGGLRPPSSPFPVGRGGVRGGAPPACSAWRCARRCERVCLATSARLPVEGVRAAPAAVLLELHAVRGVALGFLGLVVAPLALGARERNRNSHSGLGHGSICSFDDVLAASRRVKVAAGGLEPPTRGL